MIKTNIYPEYLIPMALRQLVNIANITKRNLTIRNTNINTCNQCKHFIPPALSNYPYEPFENDMEGKCKLFGEKNPVTGHIKYDLAIDCRYDNQKCGINAEYFKAT